METEKITPEQLQQLFEKKIEEVIQLNRQGNPNVIGTCFECHVIRNGVMAGERVLLRNANKYAEQYQIPIADVYKIISRANRAITKKYNGDTNDNDIDDDVSDFSWNELDNNKQMKVIPPINEGFDGEG